VESCVFSKNRDRLLTSDVAQQFFAEVNKQARRFMSDEHFTVDGTLIQAWASQKSFRSKDGSDDGDGTNFHGSNDRTRRMNRPPMPMRGCTRRVTAGVEAELSGPRAGGEPQRPDRRGDGDARRRICRARRCAADAPAKTGGPFAAASPWAPTRLTTVRILSARCES